MSTGKDVFRNKKTFTPPQKTNLGRSSVIESHGPDGKVRGNAQQLIDRYTLLGKDALRDSDVVLAESYFQYAEHYRRILSTMRRTEVSTELNKPASNTNAHSNEPLPSEETIILAPHLGHTEPSPQESQNPSSTD